MKHPSWERAWKPSLDIRLSDHVKCKYNDNKRRFAIAMNRLFPSSPQFLFQNESRCEMLVMAITSTFNLNENCFRNEDFVFESR